MDDAIIAENYKMIKMRGANTVENTEAYRIVEESTVASLMNRELELQKQFQYLQTDQEHRAKHISVKTRRVGATVELSWTTASGYVLRG